MTPRVLVFADVGNQFARGFLQHFRGVHPGQLAVVNEGQPVRSFAPDGVRVREWGSTRAEASLGRDAVSLLRHARDLVDDADVVVVHFLRRRHALVHAYARVRGVPYVVALWGSDWLRLGGGVDRALARWQVRGATRIICSSPAVARAVERDVDPPPGVLAVHFLGTGPGQVLVDRRRAGLPAGDRRGEPVGPAAPLRVVVGNSARVTQRHLEVLASLTAAFPPADRELLAITLPMSYGGGDAYRGRVRRAYAEAGFRFELIDRFLGDEELAGLRVAGDVYVNVPPTDSFSGSMQEHMYLGAPIVYGGWLDYSFVDYPPDRMLAVEAVAGVGAALRRLATDPGALPERRYFPAFERSLAWSASIAQWRRTLYAAAGVHEPTPSPP